MDHNIDTPDAGFDDVLYDRDHLQELMDVMNDLHGPNTVEDAMNFMSRLDPNDARTRFNDAMPGFDYDTTRNILYDSLGRADMDIFEVLERIGLEVAGTPSRNPINEYPRLPNGVRYPPPIGIHGFHNDFGLDGTGLAGTPAWNPIDEYAHLYGIRIPIEGDRDHNNFGFDNAEFADTPAWNPIDEMHPNDLPIEDDDFHSSFGFEYTATLDEEDTADVDDLDMIYHELLDPVEPTDHADVNTTRDWPDVEQMRAWGFIVDADLDEMDPVD